MLGEISNAEKRARRAPRGAVSVLITTVRRRGAVPGLERRLRADAHVPASGQIVFRGGVCQVLR
jgi:hypothetical protein